MNITELEKKAMTNIAINEMNSANTGIPDCAAATHVWVDSVEDGPYAEISGKTLSGVMSSLCQKGLAWTNGESCALTVLGYEEFMLFKDEMNLVC